MGLFATSCAACGARVEASATACTRCGRPTAASGRTERERAARQPHRAHYRSPEYRRNRLERYRLVGGRCEACGVALKGDLFPDGVPWQSDHAIALVDGGTDDVANLRCYCESDHKAKTAQDRRERRK